MLITSGSRDGQQCAAEEWGKQAEEGDTGVRRLLEGGGSGNAIKQTLWEDNARKELQKGSIISFQNLLLNEYRGTTVKQTSRA